MRSQFYAARADTVELIFGQPVAIGRLGGEFSVVSGSVWLTRSGDIEDHWLRPGQRLALDPDAGVLVEPAQLGRAAVVAWRPRLSGWQHGRVAAWRRLGGLAFRAARGASRVASAFEAIGRRASAAGA